MNFYFRSTRIHESLKRRELKRRKSFLANLAYVILYVGGHSSNLLSTETILWATTTAVMKKKMAVVKQICEHFTPMKPRNALLSTVAVPRTSSRADVTQCIFFTAGEQNLIALTPPTVHERLCIGFTQVPQIRERRQVWLSALHFLNAIWLNQNQSGWKSQPY